MAFVQTSGTDFTLNGKKWVPFGGTTYNIIGSTSAVDAKCTEALAMNLNIIRLINFFGHSDAFDEPQWSIADYAMHKARLLGLKVLLDLSDFCAVTGQDHPGFSCNTTTCRQDWLDFVPWVFNRVNTYNGQVYKSDDSIAIVAISGENNFQGGTLLYDMFNEVAGAIKATGAQQIIHAGGQVPEIIIDAGYGYGSSQDMLSAPNIDCVSTHPYYTGTDMRTLFPALQDYSIRKNKPWFIEEFGYNQSDSTTLPDKKRAGMLRFVYDIALKYGCAGFIFWNIDGGFYNEDTKTGGGYGINANTPEARKMVMRYAKYTRYSPRIPVDSLNPPVS